jgi:hypothetical protein
MQKTFKAGEAWEANYNISLTEIEAREFIISRIKALFSELNAKNLFELYKLIEPKVREIKGETK